MTATVVFVARRLSDGARRLARECTMHRSRKLQHIFRKSKEKISSVLFIILTPMATYFAVQKLSSEPWPTAAESGGFCGRTPRCQASQWLQSFSIGWLRQTVRRSLPTVEFGGVKI